MEELLDNKALKKDMALIETYYPGLFEKTIPIKMDGSVVGYTSNALGEYFYNDTKDIFGSIGNDYKKFLEKRKLVPAYTQSSFISTFVKKLAGYVGLGGTSRINGFFSPDANVILLFVSHASSLFGSTDYSYIEALTKHELMHFCAFNANSKFFSIYKKILIKFYSVFLYKLFEDKLKISDCANIANKYLPYSIRSERKLMTYKQLKNFLKYVYSRVIKHELSKLNVLDELEERVDDVITCLENIYYRNDIYTYLYDYGYVFKALDYAYKKIGVNPGASLLFQELLFPSEVVAISSGDNKYMDKWRNVVQYTSKKFR